MNESDALSELSLTEFNEGEDLIEVCEPVGKQYFCKVFGCPKVYSHSSSLYRHKRSVHSKRGQQSIGACVNGTYFTGSKQSRSLNPNQNITIPRVLSTQQNGSFHGATNSLLVSNSNIEDDIHELQLQMRFWGRDTLLAQFRALLDTVPNANEPTFEFWVAFSSLRHNSLPPRTA